MNQRNTLVIESGLVERNYWRDIWRYRELFYILAWRDIAVRYKQTVIGAAWALIQPFLAMVVFTVIFGKLAKLPTDGSAPYALMVYAALLPWQLFSSVFSGSAGSLLGNANLISKVYFPRLIVPTARGVVALVDFLISLIVLVGLMGWYRFLPSWHIALLPLFVIMALLASHRAQREVPRLRLPRPLRDPGRTVHLAGRVHVVRRQGPLAPGLFAQPGGRRHRRVPLGHLGWSVEVLHARLPDRLGGHFAVPMARRPQVPQDRTNLRGPDLRMV